MLYKNPSIRQALQTLIANPLSEEGIDGFKISDETKIEKEEVDYFCYRDLNNRIIGEETSKRHLTIISVSFKQNNKWRVDDGNSTYSVSIDDEIFIEAVEEGKYALSKNDRLYCVVRFRKFIQSGQLKMEHSIEKVLEHKRQQVIPLIPE